MNLLGRSKKKMKEKNIEEAKRSVDKKMEQLKKEAKDGAQILVIRWGRRGAKSETYNMSQSEALAAVHETFTARKAMFVHQVQASMSMKENRKEDES